MCLSILATLTSRNKEWPFGTKGIEEVMEVAFMTPEDGIEDTILPRFLANGGIRRRLHIWGMVKNSEGKRRTLSIKNDIELIEKALDKNPNIKVIVFDPITAYFGDKGDSYKTTDVRAVLTPLSEMLQRRGVSVIVIMHPSKAKGVQGQVLDMINGSGAWGQLPRTVLFTARNPEKSKEKVMAIAKLSIADREDAKSIVYSTVGEDVTGINSKGEEITVNTQKIELLRLFNQTADDLLAEPEELDGEEKQCKDALEHLLDLNDGISKEDLGCVDKRDSQIS